MSLRTVPVLIMISWAGVMPPAMVGTMRWQTTACRVPAIWRRIWSRSSALKKSRMRPTDWAALVVCRVERTRCPVSAALMAAVKLVASRISPIMITSGSWRRTCFSPCLEGEGVQADFALLDDRLVVFKDVFDGVFQGDDVFAAVGVDVLDHRGQGGGFAATGGAGQQDNAAGHSAIWRNWGSRPNSSKLGTWVLTKRMARQAGRVDKSNWCGTVRRPA